VNKEIDEKGKIVVLMWGGLRKNRLFAVDIENHQQKKVVGILHRLGSGVVTFVIATSRMFCRQSCLSTPVSIKLLVQF
jgi:hypothetical protein